jgi:hypothetical protein
MNVFFPRRLALASLLTTGLPAATFGVEVIANQAMPPYQDAPEFIRGDTDSNGRVELTDVIATLGFLFQNGPAPGCMAAADSNDDEVIDLSDGTRTLLVLFAGVEMPPPWPRPGADPTPGLGCERGDGGAPDSSEHAPGEAGWQVGEREFHVKIELRAAGRGLEVISVRVRPGARVGSDMVAGDVVWELCDATGACLAVGSPADFGIDRGTIGPRPGEGFDDHFEAPSASPTLFVDVDGAALVSRSLSGLRLSLYRRGETAADLERLTVADMPAHRGRTLILERETSIGELGRILAPALDEYERLGPRDLTGGIHPTLAASVTPLLINGPSAQKKELVVIGDGFDAGDQAEFNTLVDNLIVKGAFEQDVFKETAGAFNLYRINAISADSGVTTGTHANFLSTKVPSPTAVNLHPGTVQIHLPNDTGVLSLAVTGSKCSLEEVRKLIANVKFNGTNDCGEWVEYTFKTRMILSEANIDGDPENETLGELWVGAPKDLIGPAGDFTISYQPQQGIPVQGNIPVFVKKGSGTLTPKDTALNYIFNGEWDYCWLQSACDTGTRREKILELVPGWDYVVVILNQASGGGCGGGGIQVFTKNEDVGTVIHELGHGIGGLGDEYVKPRTYTGDRPTSPNLDDRFDLATIKWRDFIRPSTSLPTSPHWSIDPIDDCGAWEGGGSYSKDIYRPVEACRMKSDGNHYCPVCYTRIREILYPYQWSYFHNSLAGDFDGDGKDDLVQHSGTMLTLHLSDGTKLHPTFFATERVPGPGGGWRIRSNDRYYVGDLDGDGRDDLFVFNGVDWNQEYFATLLSTGDGFVRAARYDDAMTNWDFKPHDFFTVADFNGDGLDDVFVHNHDDWGHKYLGMLRSNGGTLTLVRRYDDFAPSWEMGDQDRWAAGDFNEDGKEDLYAQNTKDWTSRWVGMLRSNGASLTMESLYQDSLAGWEMGANDRLYVADHDGDGDADLYVSNGQDWNSQYLGMFRSSGSSLTFIELFTNTVPGWTLKPHDEFRVADINGDGRDDLYAMNLTDWSYHYVGLLRSTGSSISASYHETAIGKWEIRPTDRLLPADLDGDGKVDLILRDLFWLGLCRSMGTELDFLRRYYHWIHNYRYHGPLGHDAQVGGIVLGG